MKKKVIIPLVLILVVGIGVYAARRAGHGHLHHALGRHGSALAFAPRGDRREGLVDVALRGPREGQAHLGGDAPLGRERLGGHADDGADHDDQRHDADDQLVAQGQRAAGAQPVPPPGG